MPSFVNVNGVVTRRPGIINSVDFSANAGRQENIKRLAVVGNFPYLQPDEPVLVTSQNSMMKLAPQDAEMKRLAKLIYRPGNDSRIGNGPSEVWLVSAANSTQASYTAIDGLGEDTLTISSRAWGSAGNRTRVIATEDGGVFSFVVSRDGRVENFPNISGDSLFSLDYTGTRWTTVTGGFDGTNFTATAVKSAQAAGAFTADSSWQGTVTIDPSAGPTGGTYTASIVGVDENGDDATCLLTWADGLGHAALDSVGDGVPSTSFSSISTITLANNGGGGSPTFNISGTIYSVTKADFPFVGQLVSFLQTLDLGTPDEFTVSSVSPLASGVRFEDMDFKVATTDLSTNVTFTNLMTKLVAKLNTSALIEVEHVSGGGAPAEFSEYLRAGTPGTQSVANSGDWAVALNSLRNLQPNPPTVIALLTSDLTAQSDLAAHCGYMWGAGKYEVQAWTGAAAGASKTAIKAATLALNDYRVSYVAQEAYITRVDGAQEWIEPFWYALAHASAHASVGIAVPLTWKRLNVLDVRNGTTWDVEDDIEEMLGAGVTLTTKGPQGLRIERSLTTHLSDDDAARTAPSAVESIANYLRRVRARLEALIGDPARSTTRARIISLVISESRQAQRDGVIARFDEQSIDAEQVGDVFVVSASIAPVYEVTFINFVATIIPVTLDLAA